MWQAAVELYPIVSMHAPGEAIKVSIYLSM